MTDILQLDHGRLAGSITLEEIYQQPALWATTMAQVQHADVSCLPANGTVIVTGAGTSAYAGEAIAKAWPGAKAIPTTDLLLQSREDLIRTSPGFEDCGVLVSLARSGESPESIAVVEKIKRLFPAVQHVVITCNPDGRLAKLAYAQKIILDPRTNDRSLAMTSSFTNLVLAGLCLACGAQLEPVLQTICKDVQKALPSMNKVAREIAAFPADRCTVLASCNLQPLAREVALKVLEMTAGNVVALSETFLGLRHGPMSFLRPDSVVLCWMSSDAVRRRYEYDLIQELRNKNLGGLVIIGPTDTSGTNADVIVPAQSLQLPDELRVPFEVVFGQLLAYHLSLRCGLNPDDPSPDGVITRVVRGFRLHED